MQYRAVHRRRAGIGIRCRATQDHRPDPEARLTEVARTADGAIEACREIIVHRQGESANQDDVGVDVQGAAGVNRVGLGGCVGDENKIQVIVARRIG